MTDSDFEWVDFFNLANSLIKDADEAKQRTSISRYYYSAFCESRDSLIKNKIFLDQKSEKIIKSKSGKVHFETQKTFQKDSRFKNGELISKNLISLRRNRNKADYDLELNSSLNDLTDESKTKSEMIFNLLEKEFD